MESKPHMRRYPSDGYDPSRTRDDIRYRCTVCGFTGIDGVTTQEPEQAVFSLATTGTTYAIPAGTSVDNLHTVIDKTAVNNVGARAGCPFCGSPNWAWASEPSLRW